MARDEKPGKSGAARPPVIDLKADEIKDKDAPGKTKKDGNGQDSPAEKTARTANTNPDKTGKTSSAPGKAQASPSGQDKTDDKPASAAPQGKKPARADKMAKADKPAPEDKPLPDDKAERHPPRLGKAGLIGGALIALVAISGAGGAWLYASKGPANRLAALQQRIQGLEKRLAAAPAPDAAIAPLRKQVADLKTQVAALKDRTTRLDKALADMKQTPPAAIADVKKQLAATTEIVNANARALAETRQQLSGLEAKFTTLRAALDKAASGKTSTPATLAADVRLKLKESAQALQSMSARIARLEQAQRQMRSELAKAGPDAAAMKDMAEKLTAQQKAITALRTALQDLQNRAAAAQKSAAAAMAAVAALKKAPPRPVLAAPPPARIYAALRDKADAGKPFAEELQKLKVWVPLVTEYDTLQTVAKTGAPPLSTLKRELAALAAKYARAQKQAAEREAKKSLVGALKSQLSQVVKVRRKDRADWAGALAQANKALDEGSLTAAIGLLENQPGTPPEDIAAWLKGARARMLTDKPLSDIGEAVMTLIAEWGRKNAQ